VALLSSGTEGQEMTGDLVAAFRGIRSRAKAGKGSIKSLIEEGRR
jgi:hypothetical protein